MADNNNNNGSHYVAENAVFSCNQGVAPAQLQVMQNQTLCVQNQLVATDKEVTFNPPAQTFGTCSLNPNKQAGQPCMYASNGQWNPSTVYLSNGKSVLVEDSELICPVFGGKVGVIYHGQTASVSVAQLETCETELAPSIMKVENKANDNKKKKKAITGFAVNKIKRGTIISSKVKEIYVRKGENITVEVGDPATLTPEQKKYVSWIIGRKYGEKEVEKEKKTGTGRNAKTVKEKVKEDLYMCEFFDTYQSPFVFHLDFLGEYFIEGVGYKKGTYRKLEIIKKNKQYWDIEKNWRFDSDDLSVPTDKNASFLIHVVENSIKSIFVEETGVIKKADEKNYYAKQGSTLKIKVNTFFDNYDTNWEIVHCDISQKAGTVPEDMYQYTDGSLELTLTPKNAGEIYTVNFRMHRKYKISKKHDTEGEKTEVEEREDREPISTKGIFIHCYDVVKIVGKGTSWGNDDVSDTISKARPGACITFKVVREDGTVTDEDLEKVDWKITYLEKPGLLDKEENDKKEISYEFLSPGRYQITASLKDTRFTNGGILTENGEVIKNGNCTEKKITHEIEIKNNKVTGIRLGNISRYIYAGVKYPIELKYDYGDKTSGSEKKSVKFNVDDGAEIIGNSFFKASVEKEYNLRAVLNWETCSKKIKVVMPTYDKWQFSDSKGKKINQIARFRNNGQSYEFGIDVSVPAWQILKGMTENKNVYVVLYGLGTVIKLYNNVKLSDEGSFSITKISVKEIIDILKKKGVYKGKGDVLINFNVHNMPTDQIRNINRTNKQGIYLGTCSLRITDKFVKEGSFIDPDKDNKKLIDIKKYGDKVKVWLRILNPGDRKLCLRVYENKSKSWFWEKNPIVYEKKDFQIDDDGNVEIEIPTNGGKIKKDEHGDKKLPRLFYFQLECDDKVVYSYPQSPGDLYNYDVIKNKEQITNNKQEQSKARSYFEQLKLLPETKDSEYCETYSKLVPVVIGEEEKKKDDKKDDCRCPNCHEDAAKLKERLKKIFPNATDENVKIAAETYTTYMKKFQMDTCWIKAHFFAQAYIETGGTLSPKSEGFNYSVANLYYSGTFSKFKEKKELCAEYGACNNEANFKYKYKTKSKSIIIKTFEKSWLGSIKPHSCDQKKLANYVYSDKSELGNKGGDDGWNFRGRGVTQVTGRNAYETIEKILKTVGYDGDCDISSSLEKADRVATVELGIVSSMAFFWYKNANMYRLCNGKADDADVENVSNKVGAKNPECKMEIEGEPCISNHNGKKMAFRKIMKKNFEVDDCKWDEFTEEEEKLKMASYHIYANGHVEKHIPANLEDKDHYAYFYHTEDGVCVEICRRTIKKVRKMKEDSKVTKYTGKEPSSDKYDELWTYSVSGTDGEKAYIMKNGDRIVYPRPAAKKKGRVPYLYKAGEGDTELVQINEGCGGNKFSFNDKINGIKFSYTITNGTQRFFSNPDVFACFIGIIVEIDYDLEGAGNVDEKNTGYPSVSHKNGYAFDFRYKTEDEDKDIKLLEAAYKFRCCQVLIGTKYEGGRRASVLNVQCRKDHNDHIHVSVYGSATKICQPTIIKE